MKGSYNQQEKPLHGFRCYEHYKILHKPKVKWSIRNVHPM